MIFKTSGIKWFLALAALFVIQLVVSCASTKHVPDGKFLLDDVTIQIMDKENQNEDISSAELVNYLRQTENHKVLGGLKLQLALYNISGKDSTKWFNRWVQRLGTPPVIYDSTLTEASVNQLSRALSNKGYMNNQVTSIVDSNAKKKKVTNEASAAKFENTKPAHYTSLSTSVPA